MKPLLISRLVILLDACSSTHSVIDAKLPEASQQFVEKSEAEELLSASTVAMDSFLLPKNTGALLRA